MNFGSIKTKLIVLVTAVLAFISLTLMLFTQREVDMRMTDAQEQNARNIIRLVKLDIENEYNNLLQEKKAILEMRKLQMKNITSAVVSNTDTLFDAYKKGVLSEEDARRMALQSATGFTYSDNDYVYVFNAEMVAIGHPDKAVSGRNLSDYKDLKGNYVIRDLMKASRRTDNHYTNYWWKRLDSSEPKQKLGYAISYPKWKWMIGTGVYIDDIETEARRRLDAMIGQLRTTLSKIKIADSGYVFIFDGKRRMITHPELSGKDVTDIKDPATGKSLFDELVEASRRPDKAFEYLWDRADRKGEFKYPKEAYVEYFAPLDWYIASSVYKDELKQPARTLVRKQVVLILIVFFAGVVLTYVFITRVLKPIKILTAYTKELVSNEFVRPKNPLLDIDRFPAIYRDEVGKLAESFIFMEMELGQYIRDLKAKVVSLEIRIDEKKRKEDVENITETDYFRLLAKKAEELKAE